MSIYVGDKKFDLHYTTTGNKVNRSVFKGENKLWPLYEFSFYDGSMQKTIENIPASGKTENIIGNWKSSPFYRTQPLL